MLVAVPSHAEDQWADTFYQYRIPIDVKVEEPGMQRVSVDPEQIIAAINTTEELKFDPTFFAYNHLKVVGEDGVMVDDAGFHLIPVGPELMTTTLTGEDQKVNVPTEKDEPSNM